MVLSRCTDPIAPCFAEQVGNVAYPCLAPLTLRATSACLTLPASEGSIPWLETMLISSAPTGWYADDNRLTTLLWLTGDIGSSPSSGSANGSEAVVAGRDMADSLEFGLCESRSAMYGGGAVSCESGRIAICTPPAASASLYGGAGDSSDRTLGCSERSDVCEGCDRAVGLLRTDVALEERPPIKSSASKLKTRRCLAHLLPRGSPLETVDDESLLRLRRANIMNAIMRPRPIKVIGTATAACFPGEQDMPLHDFDSERTADNPLVAEAAAADVKDVLSVELVGDVIEEYRDVDSDSARVFDVEDAASGTIVGDEDE